MKLELTKFTVAVDEHGRLSANMALHAHFDVSPTWFEIAWRHLLDAETHEQALVADWIDSSAEQREKQLDLTFCSNMQVVTASAIAVDAFYAAVKDRVGVPADLSETWRTKRTARHKQIAEVFRRTFLLTSQGFTETRRNLRQIFELRDQAVHPNGATRAPARHPSLHEVLDAPFVLFRFEHAKAVYQATLALIAQLARAPREKAPMLVDLCKSTIERTDGLVLAYATRFGKLWPDQPGMTDPKSADRS